VVHTLSAMLRVALQAADTCWPNLK
jgi:hypothetical protein